MVALYHKEYVPAYLRCLQQNKQGGDETIVKLDAQLDENVILLFRRMAHAKFKAMQKATGECGRSSRQAAEATARLGGVADGDQCSKAITAGS